MAIVPDELFVLELNFFTFTKKLLRFTVNRDRILILQGSDWAMANKLA